MNFPGGSDGKESACNAVDPGSISGSGRSPGEGKGNPLQYSCRENSTDRESWWATVMGSQRVDTSEATEQNPREYVLRRNGKVEILVCMNDIDHSSPFYIGGLRIRLN